jgi:hypothetical protein
MSDKLINYDIDYTNWDVEQCLNDTIWLLMVDEPDGELVLRKGLYVKTQDTVKNAFRIGLVLNAGPDCKTVKEGQYVTIPPGTGFYGHQTKEGHKTWFISEKAVMAVVKFTGTKEEMIRSIKENLQGGI